MTARVFPPGALDRDDTNDREVDGYWDEPDDGGPWPEPHDVEGDR